ncbi:MAG: hypothetical protein V7K40_25690 [Nostoc sp.]
MDFESIINMPVIGQTIAYAIEDGRQWGLSFANNAKVGRAYALPTY